MEDALITARFLSKEPTDGRDSIQSHVDTLAERLEETYRVARENNKVGRERQKEQYDKGTKLKTFQPGEMVYLRRIIKDRRGCPKFRIRWKGPYEVLRRLSDLNYLIRLEKKREAVLNVNKMKRCYRRIAPSTPTCTDIPDQEPEGGGGRDLTYSI
jgi:hypothetical protein